MKASLSVIFLLLYAVLAPLALLAQGQPKPEADFRVYDSSGRVVTLDDVVSAMSRADVVFIGETHNDAIGHRLELKLLEGAEARYGAGAQGERA